MLKQLKIENFRCFKSFELNQLGRVNLLVGKNNSGKTSILEAIQLLHSGNNIDALKRIMHHRDNLLLKKDIEKEESNFDWDLIFYQYQKSEENYINIKGNNKSENINIELLIKYSLDHLYAKFLRENENIYYSKNIDSNHEEKTSNFKLKEYVFFLNWIYENKDYQVSYKTGYTIDLKIFKRDINYSGDVKLNNIEQNNFILNQTMISSASLNIYQAIEMFNKIVLTENEDFVYQALKIIEPKIKRISPIMSIDKNNYYEGFWVLLSDNNKRIPIGNMGDGVWRMLSLSLALVAAKDGVLLVDEINTGLHYTALEDMWELIWETAKKLNVQVFATTHSRDCYEALEVLANRDDVGEEDISIQRIEKDATKSVPYNKEEIAVAAEREIEVR